MGVKHQCYEDYDAIPSRNQCCQKIWLYSYLPSLNDNSFSCVPHFVAYGFSYLWHWRSYCLYFYGVSTSSPLTRKTCSYFSDRQRSFCFASEVVWWGCGYSCGYGHDTEIPRRIFDQQTWILQLYWVDFLMKYSDKLPKFGFMWGCVLIKENTVAWIKCT